MVSLRHGTTWYGQPVVVHDGPLGGLREQLPSFSRQPFGPENSRNAYLRTIVREPFGEDSGRIPVAAVSTQYELIQHREVVEWLAEGLKAFGHDPDSLTGRLTLSQYGERMHLRLGLPQFDFDPGDGHPLSLMVHALNSVDKSTALEVGLGWWRQVCSNGMKVRVRGSTTRRIHLVGRVGASQVAEVLKAQLAVIPAEHKRYRQWLNTSVTMDQVEHWADEKVARVWGPHAAARLCHIARTGWDGRIEDPFEKAKPHERQVASERQVPGAFALVKNAFHVSQALSWLASRRRTLEDQFERTARIGGLIASLLEGNAG
jgi:hypothetical protein